MNYARIYKEFITDRRENLPDKDEYTERHHVIPRCMGGGNGPENLVDLKPEDHFFAHLLLAKVHNTFDLWNAARLMAQNFESGLYIFRRKTRLGYGIAKRNWVGLNRGLSHPRADLTQYTFYNIGGTSFVGTRIDFGSFADVPYASVNLLVRGIQKVVYGWSLIPTNEELLKKRKSKASSLAGKALRGFVRDKKNHVFFNRDLGLTIIAKQHEMVAIGYLNKGQVSALVTGARFLSEGWVLEKNKDFAYEVGLQSGDNRPRLNRNIYTFMNFESCEFIKATISEMGEKYNSGDGRPFGELARGGSMSWKGWCLSGTPENKIRTLGKKFSFFHEKHGPIECSKSELADRYGFSRILATKLVRGDIKSTQGWRMT